MIFRRKKKEPTLAQIASHFVMGRTRTLSKKDLEIEIEGLKFYFIDIPLKRKE